MRSAEDGARALRAVLREQGGELAAALNPDLAGGAGTGAPGPAQLAAAGPRARGRAASYELLVEMILEGSRLHYGGARVVAEDDPDLALLLGDQLYAHGLVHLAGLGDLEAVGELADLISLIAAAEADEDRELADAAWRAGAAAIGWGTTADHERAKELARSGADGAVAALRAETAAQVHLGS